MWYCLGTLCCCSGEEPAALCSLYRARAGSAPLPGDMAALALLPRAHPWPCSTAHLCSQCSSWLKLCCEPVLSWWDLPVPFLTASPWMGISTGQADTWVRSREGSWSLLPFKAHPSGKGSLHFESPSGTCRGLGTQTGQCHHHCRERWQGNTLVRKQGGSCWCQCPHFQHQIILETCPRQMHT